MGWNLVYVQFCDESRPSQERLLCPSLQYTLRCDMRRSLLAKDLTKTCEFIVHSTVSRPRGACAR